MRLETVFLNAINFVIGIYRQKMFEGLIWVLVLLFVIVVAMLFWSLSTLSSVVSAVTRR